MAVFLLPCYTVNAGQTELSNLFKTFRSVTSGRSRSILHVTSQNEQVLVMLLMPR